MNRQLARYVSVVQHGMAAWYSMVWQRGTAWYVSMVQRGTEGMKRGDGGDETRGWRG